MVMSKKAFNVHLDLNPVIEFYLPARFKISPVIINYFKILRVSKKYLFLNSFNYCPDLIVIITL
jgi:hypothetical protein